MSKNDDLHKVTLNLRAGDWDYLAEIFTTRGYPTAVVVRNVVARYVDELRRRETPPDLPQENINV